MIPEKFLFVLFWIGMDDRIVSPIIFQTRHTSTCKWHRRISGEGVATNAYPSFFSISCIFRGKWLKLQVRVGTPPSRKSWIPHWECRIVYLLLIAVHEGTGLVIPHHTPDSRLSLRISPRPDKSPRNTFSLYQINQMLHVS